jgi:hypothetical protein
MLSKMTRQEKCSDQFQEAYNLALSQGYTPRQALRRARVRVAEEPSYTNRRK